MRESEIMVRMVQLQLRMPLDLQAQYPETPSHVSTVGMKTAPEDRMLLITVYLKSYNFV